MNDEITANASAIAFPKPKPEDSALDVRNGDQKLVVTIRYDGSVEFGEGYGPNAETAKEFWQILGRAFPTFVALGKRPVAFRVQRKDGIWELLESEQEAADLATIEDIEYQGLYARDGA